MRFKSKEMTQETKPVHVRYPLFYLKSWSIKKNTKLTGTHRFPWISFEILDLKFGTEQLKTYLFVIQGLIQVE